MHAYRSHTCADLTKDNVGETVRLSGWVHRIRDHGGILFIDLRDHFGTTQVLCDPDSPAFKDVEKVRSEWCIRIDGNVKARDPELVNPKLPTGEIEVFVRDLEVLGQAQELPLMVFGEQEYPEETRLKYRYLDLRRENMQRNMTLRSDVVASMRKRMWDKGFREYQTPIITASSPEGARDFLVPSRLHPGRFYALPQAPQQFKQLIMVSGFDKYFQIAPCFRDEDPRADRSPTDVYQLDLEMSFVEQQDVFDTVSPVIA
ncbi:amino acid--tRNA ligase-related protein, partial [Sagittula sp.]|uniref:amino acid--tRNA ligase-related protein n=1 Tax=Sagittula sp. TaxID=2038081 RepID=UPI0040592FAC